MPIIGLDLGRHQFRAVELEQQKGFYILKNYGNYEGRMLDLDFRSPDAVANYTNALKEFIRERDFSTSGVIVALPEQEVFIRVISTPKLSQKELNNFIKMNAEEYIPIPMSEVTFDAQIIDSNEVVDKEDSETGKTMSALLVASKNDILKKYVELIKSAGFVPKGIEPETLSIERVLGDTLDRPSACIIVNIGVFSTQIIVSYRGFVRFTRTVSVGGSDLTKAVQKALNLEFNQAEEYKKAYGLDESQVDGKVYNAIKPVFDNILLEINRSKMYYTTHNPSVIINRVILSGGTALMPGTLLYIANKLDVEAELSNPWRTIKISEKLQKDRDNLIKQGPMYSTAVGLALKEV